MNRTTSEIMKLIPDIEAARITSVFDCHIIELPKVENRAGNITAINSSTEVPFSIERVYYIYDIPGGEYRGGHGHRELHQLIVAGSGSFDLLLDDGKNKLKIPLNRPYVGLFVVPGIWRELANFSSGAICLVLASNTYNEGDYFRSYNDFVNFKHLGLVQNNL